MHATCWADRTCVSSLFALSFSLADAVWERKAATAPDWREHAWWMKYGSKHSLETRRYSGTSPKTRQCWQIGCQAATSPHKFHLLSASAHHKSKAQGRFSREMTPALRWVGQMRKLSVSSIFFFPRRAQVIWNAYYGAAVYPCAISTISLSQCDVSDVKWFALCTHAWRDFKKHSLVLVTLFTLWTWEVVE